MAQHEKNQTPTPKAVTDKTPSSQAKQPPAEQQQGSEEQLGVEQLEERIAPYLNSSYN